MDNNSQTKQIIRVHVRTAGTWRAEQVAQTLLAIDRIATRVGIATDIYETCETFDYVIRHMATFGLQGKLPAEWQEPNDPTDVMLRTDLGKFATALRNAGVEIRFSQLGVNFRFLTEDVYDLLPISSRAEIEHIKMASPGSWSILLGGAIKSKGAARLLEKIFDSIFYRDAVRRKADAEARIAEAHADKEEAEVRTANIRNESDAMALDDRKRDMILDYAVALDSLVSALLNAGFDHQQVQNVIRDAIIGDIDILARHKSMGLIESLTMENIQEP